MLGDNILAGTNVRLAALSGLDLPIMTAWYNDEWESNAGL